MNPGKDHINSIPVRITDGSFSRFTQAESFHNRKKYVSGSACNDHRSKRRSSGSHHELLNTINLKESNKAFFRQVHIQNPKPRPLQRSKRDKILTTLDQDPE